MADRSGSRTGSDTRDFLRNRALDGWRPFVDHYGRTILRWCRHSLHLGEDEAAELTQRVLVKLFEKMQKPSALWDPAKGRFHAWLKTVARNAWLDACEERQSALAPGGGPVLEVLQDDAVCTDFVAHLVQKELLQLALDRTQARVSSREWQVFYLRKVEDLPAKEVAERLGLKVETVDNYTSEVRKVFKEEWDWAAGPDQGRPEGGP